MISFIKKVLGDKATRDKKAINPIVTKIKEAYEGVKDLSNDDLRAKTQEFKDEISLYFRG